jgi:hypothetical protein
MTLTFPASVDEKDLVIYKVCTLQDKRFLNQCCKEEQVGRPGNGYDSKIKKLIQKGVTLLYLAAALEKLIEKGTGVNFAETFMRRLLKYCGIITGSSDSVKDTLERAAQWFTDHPTAGVLTERGAYKLSNHQQGEELEAELAQNLFGKSPARDDETSDVEGSRFVISGRQVVDICDVHKH